MSEERIVKICTKDNPYGGQKEAGNVKWSHPDAVSTGSSDGYPGGDLDHYKCPHCGKHFTVEVAQ